jgi:hypothetical protein
MQVTAHRWQGGDKKRAMWTGHASRTFKTCEALTCGLEEHWDLQESQEGEARGLMVR